MSTTFYALCALFGVALLALTSHGATEQAESPAVDKIRKQLNVYTFSSVDYPASFAIIAGLSIVLVVGVVFIVAAMLSMEPAKDSIIYRMTTTRMKKD